MEEKKNILEIRLAKMMETLRAQGCITHSELLERLSNYM